MHAFRLVIKNLVAQGLNTLLGITLILYSTRLLSTEDFGEMRTAMTVLPLIMLFSLPGYDSVILRNSTMGKRLHLLRIFGIRVSLGVGGAVLLGLGTFLFHNLLTPSLTFFLYTIAILLPFFDTGTGYRNFLIGRRLRSKALNYILYVKSFAFLLLVCLFTLIYYSDLSNWFVLPAYMIAMIIPTLAMFLPIAWRQAKTCKDKKLIALSKKDYANLQSAVGVTAASILGTLAFSIDKLWLRYELGAEVLASYTILIMIPQEGSRLLDAMVPIFYKKLFFDKTRISFQNGLLLAGTASVIIFFYVVGFYCLSPFVFGATYQYSLLSVCLSALLLCGLTYEFFSHHRFFATYGAKFQLYYSVVNVAITVPTVICSLHLGGIDGLLLGLTLKQALTPALFLLYKRLPT